MGSKWRGWFEGDSKTWLSCRGADLAKSRPRRRYYHPLAENFQSLNFVSGMWALFQWSVSVNSCWSLLNQFSFAP